jgi:hypothetical protein
MTNNPMYRGVTTYDAPLTLTRRSPRPPSVMRPIGFAPWTEVRRIDHPMYDAETFAEQERRLRDMIGEGEGRTPDDR